MKLSVRSKRQVFALACLAVLVLSVLPGEAIPGPLHFWDKAQHALGFAVLAGLALWARLSVQAWPWALGLLCFGAAIEGIQSLLPWRFGDVWDGLADAVGVFAVLGVARFWRALRAKRPTAV